MDNDLKSLELIQLHLMEDRDVAKLYLSETQLDIRDRLAAGYTHWLENPTTPDSEIVMFLRENYGVSQRQAYADIDAIRIMLGNIKNAHKEWHRFVVIEMCKQAYKKAEANNDPKAMAMAADKLGKYTRLDQVEEDQLPWDQLVPPNFEPSTDVSIMGFKRDPDIDHKRKRLMRKYMPDVEDVDAEIVD